MKNEIKKIQTVDCVVAILNNAPAGYEEMKSIAFRFNDADHLNLLNIPKLKYLDTIRSFNDLSFHLTYEPLRQFFNNFVDGFEKALKSHDRGKDVIDKINKSLRDLVKMAEKELELSLQSCMGLYGELLELKALLEANSNHSDILAGWNRPAPANHDFDYENEAIEIKTVSKDRTTVRITSAFQLEAPEGKELYLKIFRIEALSHSGTDSLGDLYLEINAMLSSETEREEFALKCVNDGVRYGGPRVVTLPYRFILIESMKYFVDQVMFPRINRSEVPPSLSNISFSIDLSAIDEFKVGV